MKWSDIAKTVGAIAPAIGEALAGPAGSAAGSLLAHALGTDNTPDAVDQALKSDPKAAAKVREAELTHATAIAQMQSNERTAQIGVNRAEAQSGSWVAENWRAMLGMSCTAAFAWNYVGEPMAAFGLAIARVDLPANLPTADMTAMMPVLLGMLGLGGYRTIEKLKQLPRPGA